jgi:hypothetical protein
MESGRKWVFRHGSKRFLLLRFMFFLFHSSSRYGASTIGGSSKGLGLATSLKQWERLLLLLAGFTGFSRVNSRAIMTLNLGLDMRLRVRLCNCRFAIQDI